MPFIRQTRDKRGFEHTYVMHNGRPGAGAPRPRVLYVFRSPGNLKVGRSALDSEVREALEHTHPDLNFDWNALTREAIVTRAEPPPQRTPKPVKPQRPQPAPAAPPPPADDPSLLGQTLGASVAMRIRNRFNELSQRIGRRTRTPEEREALLEKLRPLNPDSWTVEGEIRERASTVEADFDRLAAEVPSRRRGRRGGRHRHERPTQPGAEGQSGIMAEGDERHEDPHDPGPAGQDRHNRPATDGGDAGVGPADPETSGFSSDD